MSVGSIQQNDPNEIQLFKLDSRFCNTIQRSMNLFFFYQSDIESLLSTHDFGFYQYQKFQNFLDHSNSENTHILKPVFTSRNLFLEYDLMNFFIQSLQQIEEMKLKDTKILGSLAKKTT